jgi:hypothetical protein
MGKFGFTNLFPSQLHQELSGVNPEYHRIMAVGIESIRHLQKLLWA